MMFDAWLCCAVPLLMECLPMDGVGQKSNHLSAGRCSYFVSGLRMWKSMLGNGCRKSNTANSYDKTSIGRVSLCLLYMTFQTKTKYSKKRVAGVHEKCLSWALWSQGLCGSSMHSECDWRELICQNKMFWNLVSIFFHKCAVSWSSEPLKTSLLSDQYMVIRQHNLLMTMITHIIIRILMNQSVWLDRIVVFFMTQVDLAIGDSDEETGTPHVYSSISLGSQICKLVCVIWCHMVKWLYVSFQTLKQQMWMGQNYATPERVGPLLPQIWGREDQKPSLIDVTIDARWW